MTARNIAKPSGLISGETGLRPREKEGELVGNREAEMEMEAEWAADRAQRPTTVRIPPVELAPARRGGGGKLSRSETVTVRLDPKLRYLAELAARRQRRTLSSYIEWTIEKSLVDVVLSTKYTEGDTDVDVTTLEDVADELWDVDPSERFARLALTQESLLTHDEQILWKHIEDTGLLAKGWIPPKKEGIYSHPGRPDWQWLRKEGFLLLRDHWDTIRKVAYGELDRSHLPRYPE